MAIRAPRSWSRGDVPDAATLNVEWRDNFRWLLGTSDRPAFGAYSTDNSTYYPPYTYWDIPMNTETLKQGGITHSANDTKAYVPVDGVYQGVASYGFLPVGGATGWKASCIILCNENVVVSCDITGQNPAYEMQVGMINFRIPMVAGDSVRLQVYLIGSPATVHCWYDGTPRCGFTLRWASK